MPPVRGLRLRPNTPMRAICLCLGSICVKTPGGMSTRGGHWGRRQGLVAQHVWTVLEAPHGGQPDTVNCPEPDAAHRTLDENVKGRVCHKGNPIPEQEKEKPGPAPLGGPSSPEVVEKDTARPASLDKDPKPQAGNAR